MAERYVFIGKEKFPLERLEKKEESSPKPKRGRPRRAKAVEPPASIET